MHRFQHFDSAKSAKIARVNNDENSPVSRESTYRGDETTASTDTNGAIKAHHFRQSLAVRSTALSGGPTSSIGGPLGGNAMGVQAAGPAGSLLLAAEAPAYGRGPSDVVSPRTFYNPGVVAEGENAGTLGGVGTNVNQNSTSQGILS